MYVIKTLTTEEVINLGIKKYREKYLTTEEVINFGNRKYLDTYRKFQGGGNAQSSEAIPPLHRGPPRQDSPSSGKPLSDKIQSLRQGCQVSLNPSLLLSLEFMDWHLRWENGF